MNEIEFYIIKDIFWIVVNQGVVLGSIAISIFVIVLLSITLPPLLKHANDEAQRELFAEINDEDKMMCGMSNELNIIFDTIDSISSDKFDNKAKGIYQQIQWGKNIESCDIIYLHKQLDVEQKKILNWEKLSCNISQCLSD